MSPRHFSLMSKGHKDSKLADYRVARLVMYTMVKLLGDSKSGPKTPEELWPLDGDNKPTIDQDEYREIFKRLAK